MGSFSDVESQQPLDTLFEISDNSGEDSDSSSSNSLVIAQPTSALTLESYYNLTKDTIQFTFPYAVYAVLLSGVTFDSLMLELSGDDDGLAAMSTIAAFVYFTMSLSKGMIDATGLLISHLHGQQQHTKIGEIARLGWLASIAISIPAMGFLASSKQLLLAIKTDPAIADKNGEFFNIYILGVPGVLCLTCCQQIALGLKHSVVASIIGSAYAVLAMPIGYPLVLGAFGITEFSGVAGLAFGMTAAAWITAIGSIAYLRFNSTYEPYQLFTLQLNQSKDDILLFLKTGGSLATSYFIEELGKILIQIRLAHWQEAAYVSRAFSPISTFISAISNSLSITTQIQISNTLGQSKLLLEQQYSQAAHTMAIQAKRLGNISILLISGVAILGVLPCMIPPVAHWVENHILDFSHFNLTDTSSFGDGIDEAEIVDLADDMGIFIGLSTLVNSIRTVMAGGLSGYRDIVIPTLINFLLTTVITFPMTILATTMMKENDLKHSYLLYATYTFSLALSTSIVGWRWLQKSNQAIDKISENLFDEQDGNALHPIEMDNLAYNSDESGEECYSEEEVLSNAELIQQFGALPGETTRVMVDDTSDSDNSPGNFAI